MPRRLGGIVVALALAGCAAVGGGGRTGRFFGRLRSGPPGPTTTAAIKERFPEGRVFVTAERADEPMPTEEQADVVVFSHLGIVLSMSGDAHQRLRGRVLSADGAEATPAEDLLVGDDEAVREPVAVEPQPTEETAAEEAAPLPAETLREEQYTWGLRAMGVPSRPDLTGRGVRIAVLDTGVDAVHPDLLDLPADGRMRSTPDVNLSGPAETRALAQDMQGHGTRVCGLIHGTCRDDQPETDASGAPAVIRRYGVAPGATLLVCQVTDDEGKADDGWVIRGIDWAIEQHCDIVCLCWGVEGGPPTQAFEDAGKRALQNGLLVVAAAGDEGRADPPRGCVACPANARTILAVGALRKNGRVAAISPRGPASSLTERGPDANDGTEIDLVAPGVGVFSSAIPDPDFPETTMYDRNWAGTSAAAPYVAGIAALYIEARGRGVRGSALWRALIEGSTKLDPATNPAPEKAGAGCAHVPPLEARP